MTSVLSDSNSPPASETTASSTKRFREFSVSCWLTAVFVLAFLLRSAPIVYLEVREPGWHTDHIDPFDFSYDDVGRSLIVGRGFVHEVNPRPNAQIHFPPGSPFGFFPPLYAFWIGAVYFLFGPNIFLAKILQCLMDACVCPLLYVLGRRVTGDRNTALLSALLYAAYPLAIHIGLHLYYQIPLNLILIWLVLCLMAPATWRNGMWSGVAVGLSALAQPVTLPLLAVIPGIVAAQCARRKISVRAGLRWCVPFAAASLAVLAPWTLRNYKVYHRFVPVRNGAAAATLLEGSKDKYLDLPVGMLQTTRQEEVPSPSDYLRVAVDNHLEHLKRAPLDYLRFLARKFGMAWYNTEGKGRNLPALLVQLPFLALAIVGLVCTPGMWRKNHNGYVLAMVLYFCAIEVAFNPCVRYTLAVMPLVMLVAAVGARWLARRLLGGNRRPAVEILGTA